MLVLVTCRGYCRKSFKMSLLCTNFTMSGLQQNPRKSRFQSLIIILPNWRSTFLTLTRPNSRGPSTR